MNKKDRHYEVVVVATIKTKPIIVNAKNKDDAIGKVFSLLERHELYNIKLERTVVNSYKGANNGS